MFISASTCKAITQIHSTTLLLNACALMMGTYKFIHIPHRREWPFAFGKKYISRREPIYWQHYTHRNTHHADGTWSLAMWTSSSALDISRYVLFSRARSTTWFLRRRMMMALARSLPSSIVYNVWRSRWMTTRLMARRHHARYRSCRRGGRGQPKAVGKLLLKNDWPRGCSAVRQLSGGGGGVLVILWCLHIGCGCCCCFSPDGLCVSLFVLYRVVFASRVHAARAR